MMTAKTYARALWALNEKHPSADYGKKIVELLRAKGKEALLPAILEECRMLEKKQHAAKSARLIIARDKDEHKALEKAKQLVRDAGGDPKLWHITVERDPEAIGGYVVRTLGWEYDASYRTALYTLYQRLQAA